MAHQETVVTCDNLHTYCSQCYTNCPVCGSCHLTPYYPWIVLQPPPWRRPWKKERPWCKTVWPWWLPNTTSNKTGDFYSVS